MTVDYTQPPQAPQAPQPDAPPKKSGCAKYAVIGCIVVFLLFVIGCTAIFFVAETAVKSTDLYKGARDRAVNDPRVIAAIGPSHAGWWVTGSVSTNEDEGSGNVRFPLEGTKGDATVRATATKRGETWEFSRIEVIPDHGAPIDLLR